MNTVIYDEPTAEEARLLRICNILTESNDQGHRWHFLVDTNDAGQTVWSLGFHDRNKESYAPLHFFATVDELIQSLIA